MKITPSLLFLIFLIICLFQGFNGDSVNTVKVTYARKPGLKLNIKAEYDYALGRDYHKAWCWESLNTLQYFGSLSITTQGDNVDKSSIFNQKEVKHYKCFDRSVGVSFMKTEITYETKPDNRERIKTVTFDLQTVSHTVERRWGSVNGFRFTYATYSYLDYKKPLRYLGTVENLDRKKDEDKYRKGTLKPMTDKSKGSSGGSGGCSGGGSFDNVAISMLAFTVA